MHRDRVLSAGHPAAAHTLRYVELLKFLLWQKGGCRVLVAGATKSRRRGEDLQPVRRAHLHHLFMGEKGAGPGWPVTGSGKIGFTPVGRRFLAHDGPASGWLPHRNRSRWQ